MDTNFGVLPSEFRTDQSSRLTKREQHGVQVQTCSLNRTHVLLGLETKFLASTIGLHARRRSFDVMASPALGHGRRLTPLATGASKNESLQADELRNECVCVLIYVYITVAHTYTQVIHISTRTHTHSLLLENSQVEKESLRGPCGT